MLICWYLDMLRCWDVGMLVCWYVWYVDMLIGLNVWYWCVDMLISWYVWHVDRLIGWYVDMCDMLTCWYIDWCDKLICIAQPLASHILMLMHIHTYDMHILGCVIRWYVSHSVLLRISISGAYASSHICWYVSHCLLLRTAWCLRGCTIYMTRIRRTAPQIYRGLRSRRAVGPTICKRVRSKRAVGPNIYRGWRSKRAVRSKKLCVSLAAHSLLLARLYPPMAYVVAISTLQLTATHCNTMHHTAT